jgi:hypothetical protein
MSFFRKNPKARTSSQNKKFDAFDPSTLEERKASWSETQENDKSNTDSESESLSKPTSGAETPSTSPNIKNMTKNQSVVNSLVSNYERTVEEQQKKTVPVVVKKKETTKQPILSTQELALKKKRKCQEADVTTSHEQFYLKIKENFEKIPFIETPDDFLFFFIDDEDITGLEEQLQMNHDLIHQQTSDGLTLLHFGLKNLNFSLFSCF